MNHSQKISRLNDLSEADIRDRLCRLSHESRPEPIPEYPSLPDVVRSKPRKAAVLIPLVAHRRGWHLLLTRRNEALPEHAAVRSPFLGEVPIRPMVQPSKPPCGKPAKRSVLHRMTSLCWVSSLNTGQSAITG